MSTVRRLLALLVLSLPLATSVGCKKPEVEVEEEGPPLPLPERGGRRGPGPETPSSTEPSPAKPETPIDTDEACRLFDAHLAFAGIDVAGRECSNLRLQGESLRLDRYYIPRKDEVGGLLAMNACLWRREDGDGWEVGYVDQTNRPCQSRDDYCKVGAPGRLRPLSFRACPGDKEHLVVEPRAVAAKLAGTWRDATGDELSIGPDGKLTLQQAGQLTSGRYAAITTTRMEVTGEDGVGVELGYALAGGALYLARGLVAPAKDPEAFTLILSPNSEVRRFRGACYDIADPPRDLPKPVPCTVDGTGDGATVVIEVSPTRTIALIRLSDFWMDATVLRARFERATPKEGSEPEGRPQ